MPARTRLQIAEWIEDYGEDSDFVRVRAMRGLPPGVPATCSFSTPSEYGKHSGDRRCSSWMTRSFAGWMSPAEAR